MAVLPDEQTATPKYCYLPPQMYDSTRPQKIARPPHRHDRHGLCRVPHVVRPIGTSVPRPRETNRQGRRRAGFLFGRIPPMLASLACGGHPCRPDKLLEDGRAWRGTSCQGDMLCYLRLGLAAHGGVCLPEKQATVDKGVTDSEVQCRGAIWRWRAGLTWTVAPVPLNPGY